MYAYCRLIAIRFLLSNLEPGAHNNRVKPAAVKTRCSEAQPNKGPALSLGFNEMLGGVFQLPKHFLNTLPCKLDNLFYKVFLPVCVTYDIVSKPSRKLSLQPSILFRSIRMCSQVISK